MGRVSRIVMSMALALGAIAVLAERPRAQDSPTLSAMKDELDRSMMLLRLADQPSPYYIEYEVEDRAATRVTARLGALAEDLAGRSRTLRVVVRVGDYSFDSSLFNAPNFGSGVLQLGADGSTTAPIDDDYDAMRRQIWLASDAAYKHAVSVFARKKAAFQNRTHTDPLPDFSKEEATTTILQGLPPTTVNRAWPDRARSLSAVFLARSSRAFDSSEVSVADTRGTRYYLNSEGFKVVEPIQIASIRVFAEARADDGMMVRNLFTLVEKNLQDLPPIPEIQSRTEELARHVETARSAPVGEEYTGPVLLQGQASAEIVAQILIPAVLARRPAESAGGRGGGPGGGRGGGQVTPFLSRIGLRVLTDSFSLADTPSLKEFGGRPVPGAYVVDDFGIHPKDVTLVEKGRLVTLLTGRAPMRGLLQSNGHTRGGNVQAGVIQMRSTDAVPASELRRKYLDLLKAQGKEFGYIVREVSSPDQPASSPGGPVILTAVRVSLDGDEQPVRGLRFGAIAPPVFRDLLDASRERMLYSYRGTSRDAVSVIVPDLIFEELEIQRAREITQKPPSVPSPLTD